MDDQSERIEWRDGDVPVSTLYDDPFFSLEGGVAESRHVFLDGNDLPKRFAPGFHIAELGFGTGLNLLVAWDAWVRSGQEGALHFTSFEAHPMARGDMVRAHAAFPDFGGRRDILTNAWKPYGCVYNLPQLVLEIVEGDAAEQLKIWNKKANAWFLDGFSPAKNPEMWCDTLLQAVAHHTLPNGTFATYTAAGHVRRGLEAAGFDVTRAPGFGRKRHMSRGRLR